MKIIRNFLLAVVLVVGCLALVGCDSKVDISDHIVEESSSESFTSSGHVWEVRYYVDPSIVDIGSVEKIEMEINGKEVFATIPYDGRDTNCFEVRYVDPDYNYVNMYVDRCVAYVSDSAGEEADEGEVHDSNTVSVGATILIGAVVTLIAIFIYWQAISAETVLGLNVSYALHAIFMILTFGFYVAFGVGQGIVMTVYLAIYIGVTEGIFKRNYNL